MRWLVLFLLAVAACTGTTTTATDYDAVQQSGEVLSMKISSPAFEHNSVIPKKFTCEGDDFNPELNIGDVPANAKSLVLIMDDPDAPAKVWEHWTVINIPASTTRIPENSVPGIQLTNDFRRVEWGGPCPPPGKVHHYRFKLYAIDTALDLDSSASKADVEAAMEGHVIQHAELVGVYER